MADMLPMALVLTFAVFFPFGWIVGYSVRRWAKPWWRKHYGGKQGGQ